MKRFPWILTLAVLPCLVLLIGLGVWQVQRLHWKEGLIAQADAAAKAPPAPIAEVLTAPNPEFRKALIVCPGLPTAPYVELQTIHDGSVGVRLVSVCRAPGEAKPFLIDRGFLPDTVPARPRVLDTTLPLSLLVELRRTPKGGGGMTPAPSKTAGVNHFYARDSAAMAKALGAPDASEFTLYALSSTNPELGALQASAPPAAFANNHFGYALTWFGLAVALMGFYVAMLRRRLAPASAKDTH
ncbi:SURF1 family protein [Brevundimonas goettingensis]|uniref:SURF1-like protein n=1 Tax=Brevundimonas goettingensis TaxID=2774190 RepID=A0A975GV84_9CAUL|nr:SURF1 family protein [Brevundimonas goettingensis]QTC91121.1 SURF1 family protein [Brevundimonas goettingensis]